jgi:hypothetical protein
MQYTDERYRLRVEVTTRDCEVPADQRARLQRLLDPLGEVVRGFPRSELWLKLIHHEGNAAAPYHVEAKLKLPGRTLFSGDWDAYLDTALQRCLSKLTRKAEAYRDDADRPAVEAARRRQAMDRNIVAAQEPEDPDTGPLGRALANGDYKAFRTALAGYEDWLRLRIGRWVQRYPGAEERLGDELLIGDLVEEVYLNAFERFGQKAAEVSLRDWMEGLIDPSLRALLRNPAEGHENASMARTLRETPL